MVPITLSLCMLNMTQVPTVISFIKIMKVIQYP